MADRMFDPSAEPPSRKLLKERFLDAHRRDYPSDMINCAAHLILTIDDPEALVGIGLEFITGKLSACRADLGFVRPEDTIYQPLSVSYNARSAPPQCDGVGYPNRKGIFQRTWRQSAPVACDDVGTDPLLQDSRQVFQMIESRSILFQRLSVQRKPVGLMCVDFTHDLHAWTQEEMSFVLDFSGTFLGPLAWISQACRGPQRDSSALRPSPAELAVIRLAAHGLSYRKMADVLGKSVRTVENQLRGARLRLDAANQAELIRKCELWL